MPQRCEESCCCKGQELNWRRCEGTGAPGMTGNGSKKAGTPLAPGFEPIPNVPPFPNITFGGSLHQRVEDTNRDTGSSETVRRAATAIETPARDGKLAGALEIEDRSPIASPL